MTPRHDPTTPADSFGFLDWVAGALIAIAIYSLVGVAAGWWLGHAPTIWRFTWALLGSGATLVAIGVYQGRRP